MKKLMAFIISLFMFTACSGGDTPIQSPQEEISLYLTKYNIVGAADFMLTQEQAEFVAQQIKLIQPEEIENSLKKEFYLDDIDVKVSNIRQIDNVNISFDATFTNTAGKNCTVPMGARLYYYMYNRDGEQFIHWDDKTIFCDICHYSGGQLIINRHNNPVYKDVLVYDGKTMKAVKNNIDLSVYNYDYVLDIIKCDDGYAFLYAGYGVEGFGLIDTKGQITKYPVEGREDYSVFLTRNYYPENFKSSLNLHPNSGRYLKWLDEEQNYLIYKSYYDGSGSYVHSFDSDVTYYVKNIHDVEKDGCVVTLMVAEEIARFGRLEEGLLVIRKDGDDEKIAVIHGDLADVFIGSDYQEELLIDTGRLPSEITVTSTGMEQKITVDIDAGTMNIEYMPTESRLGYEIQKSKDGNYSLWTGNRYGGGDVSYDQIILKNNQTGQLKYIDTIGGMYGGSEDTGFFSNGDVYTIALDEFKVFTTDMAQQEPAFEMSKNFPLGSGLGEDVYFRHLLSARRNPDDHSWIVLYNEGPENNVYIDGDSWGYYNSTYKIGILDPQGNLTKVYDTGEYVKSYAFNVIEMYMAGDNVIHFEVLHKGTTPGLKAELDLTTGRYTCLYGGYNQVGK